jgi:PleD family two-component response regulator
VIILPKVRVKRRNECSQSEFCNLIDAQCRTRATNFFTHSAVRVGQEGRESVKNGADQIKNCRICLLDDDSSVLRATKRLLVSEGWKVEAFSDPMSFLQYARTDSCGVAVLDVLMPVMSGLEVQSRLRDVSPSTRVVILTSLDDPAASSRALDAGALAVFLKPVNDDDFLKQIQAAAVNGTDSE